MSKTDLEALTELVLGDLSLQDRLCGIVDGEEFISSVIGIGAERGLALTREDIADAMRENKRRLVEQWN
jgi:hypothetical protein